MPVKVSTSWMKKSAVKGIAIYQRLFQT